MTFALSTFYASRRYRSDMESWSQKHHHHLSRSCDNVKCCCDNVNCCFYKDITTTPCVPSTILMREKWTWHGGTICLKYSSLLARLPYKRYDQAELDMIYGLMHNRFHKQQVVSVFQIFQSLLGLTSNIENSHKEAASTHLGKSAEKHQQ